MDDAGALKALEGRTIEARAVESLAQCAISGVGGDTSCELDLSD
jgi:hypothetical protein